ncbi:MAG: porin [Parvibaculaceae bacterium]|nr:porin [Parvibaculaceae bacterium]
MYTRLVSAAFIFAVFMGTGASVRADTVTDRIDRLEHELAVLRSELARRDELAEQKKADAKPGQESAVSFSPGKLEIKTADGNFSAGIGGNIQFDGYSLDSKQFSKSGTGFRRARLFLNGTVYKDWSYLLQVDFAGNAPLLATSYIAYRFAPQTMVYAGYPMEPFGLQNSMSNAATLFMEKPLTGLLWPGNAMGVNLRHSDGKSYGLNGGIFSIDPVNPTRTGLGDTTGWAVTGRGWGAPVNEVDSSVHVGLSGSYRNVAGYRDKSRKPYKHDFGTRAEVANLPIVLATGPLTDVDHIGLIGPELAVSHGPFELEGEYLLGWVNFRNGRRVKVESGYVEAGAFLRGRAPSL